MFLRLMTGESCKIRVRIETEQQLVAGQGRVNRWMGYRGAELLVGVWLNQYLGILAYQIRRTYRGDYGILLWQLLSSLT